MVANAGINSEAAPANDLCGGVHKGNCSPCPRGYLDQVFPDDASRGIINECDGVPGVVYNISGKPPATIEWG